MTTILSISGLISLISATSVFADSLTLTIPSSPLSLDLNPSVNNGFATTSGSFNVKTDNSAGYTTSIKSKNESGDNSLINGNNKLTSISGPISEDTFKNGSTYINMWGWLPSKLNSEDNTNYQIAPGSEEVVLDKTEVANIEGQEYNIALAAKVTSDTPTGTYTNTFVVTALSNATPQKEYEPVECWGLSEGETSTFTDPRDGTTYKIARLKDNKCWMIENLRITGSSTFKSGHTKTLNSSDSDLPDGTTYELPTSATWTDSSNNANSNHAYYDNNPSYGAHYTWYAATAGTGTSSMTTRGQNAPGSICPKGWRLPTGGTDANADFQLLAEQYTSSSQLTATPTPAFTYAGYYNYVQASLLRQGSYGYYWSSTVYNSTAASYLYFDSSRVYPAYNFSHPYGNSVRCVARGEKPENKGTMQTVDQWGDSVKEEETVLATDERDDSVYSVSRLKDGKLWMTQNLRIIGQNIDSTNSDLASGSYDIPEDDERTAFATTADNRESNHAYYGGNTIYGAHYTWYTATAGTGASLSEDGDNAPGSICPKGWKLPTSGNGGDFPNLVDIYGDELATWLSAPLNYTYPGFIHYSDASLKGEGGQNGEGDYWSSTVYNSTLSYNMGFYFSALPQRYFTRADGFSVRCVQREPKKISDLQYLQDFANLNDEEKTQVLNSMEDETNYTLTDNRDNTQYTIAKLKDGKIWMTQNLRITGSSTFKSGHSKKLNSSDSDLTGGTTYELPTSATWTDSSTNSNHAYYADNTSYGAYYTWYTATAGTGTSSMTTRGQNAPGSICPKGWRLPTGGTDANVDFQLLAKQYTKGSQLTATPVPAFTYAGYLNYSNGSLIYQYSNGSYWSSTVLNSTGAYHLLFDGSSVLPAGSSGISRPHGLSVRCVAR